MSSLTYKIIDAINDLSGGSSGTGSSSGDQGSGSSGGSTGGFHYIKNPSFDMQEYPAYISLCKTTRGSFFDGYIYWNKKLLHAKVTVDSESKIYGYILSAEGLNPTNYKWSLIESDAQKYVGLEYANPLLSLGGTFYMMNIMCSNGDDIKLFGMSFGQSESHSELTINSTIDIVQSSA